MTSFYAWVDRTARYHYWEGSASDPCAGVPGCLAGTGASLCLWETQVCKLGKLETNNLSEDPSAALVGQREDNMLVGTGLWFSWQSWSRNTLHMLMVWHNGSVKAAAANGEMLLKGYSPACPPLLSHPAIAEPQDKLAWQAVPVLGRQVCSPRCGRVAESQQALRNASPGTCREPTWAHQLLERAQLWLKDYRCTLRKRAQHPLLEWQWLSRLIICKFCICLWLYAEEVASSRE